MSRRRNFIILGSVLLGTVVATTTTLFVVFGGDNSSPVVTAVDISVPNGTTLTLGPPWGGDESYVLEYGPRAWGLKHDISDDTFVKLFPELPSVVMEGRRPFFSSPLHHGNTLVQIDGPDTYVFKFIDSRWVFGANNWS